VLACTHFPLLRGELESAGPAGVAWIDSGAAVARRVLDVLPPARGGTAAFDLVLTSAAADTAMRHALAQFGFESVEMLHT
jgi:glutamate racemase